MTTSLVWCVGESSEDIWCGFLSHRQWIVTHVKMEWMPPMEKAAGTRKRYKECWQEAKRQTTNFENRTIAKYGSNLFSVAHDINDDLTTHTQFMRNYQIQCNNTHAFACSFVSLFIREQKWRTVRVSRGRNRKKNWNMMPHRTNNITATYNITVFADHLYCVIQIMLTSKIVDISLFSI